MIGFTCLSFFLHTHAQFFEEPGKHVAALLFQDSSGYFYLVIERGVFQDVEYGSGTAGLGIHAANDHLGDAGLDDGAGAHLAGLQGYVEGAVLQSPVADFFAGFVDSGNFGVCQGVFVGVAAVVASADNFIPVDYDTADGDFSEGVCFLGLGEGGFHVFFLSGHKALVLSWVGAGYFFFGGGNEGRVGHGAAGHGGRGKGRGCGGAGGGV